MSSWKKWTLRIVGGLVLLIVAAVGTVYALSERTMRRTYAVREVPLTLPSDSASLARGAHIVDVSCRSCHAKTLSGQILFEEPGIARLVAPNVFERIANYSDAEFAGFMRYGVHKDGTSSFVMPPRGFYHMSDADMASMIAYLRSAQPAPTVPLPANSYGPMGRLGVVMGQFKTAVAEIDTTVARVGDDSLHRTTRRGEYIARVICSECHGAKLTGDATGPSPTPSLSGALGYNVAQLTTLLRTGTPRDSTTKLGLMAEVANLTLKNFTDDEIADIHAYLTALPATGATLAKR
jgi:mono/diheme cytochrome c family protein